jgi:hypothetical protein
MTRCICSGRCAGPYCKAQDPLPGLVVDHHCIACHTPPEKKLRVIGIERFALAHLPPDPRVGEAVGLLVNDGGELMDEIKEALKAGKHVFVRVVDEEPLAEMKRAEDAVEASYEEQLCKDRKARGG